MRKILLILFVNLVLGSATGMNAQDYVPQLKREKPNMEQIKKEITDRTSEYYYPRLMKEHLSNDTLMKTEKYRRLYLGYMLQEDYSPYRIHPVSQRMLDLYKKSDKITRAEADEIIAFADTVLADNPFDLRQILCKIQACRVKGKTNTADILDCKLKYIIYAILSTGTGNDRNNAWWVVSPDNEYFLLNYLGYIVTNRKTEQTDYEILSVKDDKGYNAGDFYFNISYMVDEYFRKHPEEAGAPDEGLED